VCRYVNPASKITARVVVWIRDEMEVKCTAQLLMYGILIIAAKGLR
jgi:hypothetical protein